MTIYHLNCGSMYPYYPRIESIVYCLLIETSDGLALVDTGFGAGDYTTPSWKMRIFTALLRSPRDLAETAVRQVASLGFAPENVRHIVMTHLHLDHAGGLRDFPRANVHIYACEHEAAMSPRGWKEWFYDSTHWAHRPKWVQHDLAGEQWFGFEAVRVNVGFEPAIYLIPLPGHTRGHCGVAVDTNDGWLLHCGDAAYPFYHNGDGKVPLGAPPGWLVRLLLGANVPRLKLLWREYGDTITFVSSHDVYGYLQRRAPSLP